MPKPTYVSYSDDVYEHLSDDDVVFFDAPYLVRKGQIPKDAGTVIKLNGEWRLLGDLWEAKARPHRLTRPMTEGEFTTLKSSIETVGEVTHAVTIDAAGNFVDGFHRTKALVQLEREGSRIKPYLPYQFVQFKSKQAEETFVLLQNLARRHMRTSDRTRIARHLLTNGCNHTDSLLASQVGLAEETVRTLRQKLESEGKVPRLDYRVDKRGHRHKQNYGKADEVVAKQHATNSAAKPTPVSKKGKAATSPSSNRHSELIARTSDQELRSAQSIRVRGTDPSVGARVLQLLACVAPFWWKEYGLQPVTAATLLSLAGRDKRSLKLLNGIDSTAAAANLGKVISFLNGKPFGRFVISKEQQVYVLRPSDWSKHGPSL